MDHAFANHDASCLRSAWANLLGLPLNAVPDFDTPDAVAQAGLVARWLETLGLMLVSSTVEPPGFCIAIGFAAGEPTALHCVIYRNGKLVHDGNMPPDDTGLIAPMVYWTVAPHEPWQWRRT